MPRELFIAHDQIDLAPPLLEKFLVISSSPRSTRELLRQELSQYLAVAPNTAFPQVANTLLTVASSRTHLWSHQKWLISMLARRSHSLSSAQQARLSAG